MIESASLNIRHYPIHQEVRDPLLQCQFRLFLIVRDVLHLFVSEHYLLGVYVHHEYPVRHVLEDGLERSLLV